MRVRALSVRQPWAHYILRPDITDPAERTHAAAVEILKVHENRSRRTHLRGGFLIHSALTWSAAGFAASEVFAAQALAGKTTLSGEPAKAAAPANSPRGGLVGYANLTDCIDVSASRWFMGRFGYVLKDATPLPFLQAPGTLGFFWVDVPADYIPLHLRESLMR